MLDKLSEKAKSEVRVVVQNSDRVFTKEEVSKIIQSAIARATTDNNSPAINVLHEELSVLAHYIEQSHSDVSNLENSEIHDKHIPTAQDELDAVVEATEAATGSIMDACEVIEGHIEDIDDKKTKEDITNAIAEIYQACSFQDITGQRILKVVNAFKHIESTVLEILKPFEQDEAEKGTSEEGSEGVLLSGPQMPGEGMSQEDIDALLADF